MCQGLDFLTYWKNTLLEEAVFDLALEFWAKAQAHASLNGLEQGERKDDGKCVLSLFVAHVQVHLHRNRRLQ